VKCPECNAKIPKKAQFCPECAHPVTTQEEKYVKKNHKVLWFILGPIFALLLGFLAFVFIVGVVFSSYEVMDINVTTEAIDYNSSIPINITVDGFGMVATTFEVPVYLDGDLIHTFVFNYKGGRMGEVTIFDDSVDIVSDVSTSPGQHKISTDQMTYGFDVLTPSYFALSCDADEYYYVTDNDFNIDFTITNKGETTGAYTFSVSFDGELINKITTTISGETEETKSVLLNTDREGVHVLKINNQTFKMPFFAAEDDQKTGNLMDNTAYGDSKININNTTASDVTVFLVESNDPNTAIAAGYIKAGEKYSIHSIPKGDYYLVFEYGSQFVPAYYSFYYDSKNISYKINGLGTRFDLILTQEMLNTGSNELNVVPRIPEQH